MKNAWVGIKKDPPPAKWVGVNGGVGIFGGVSVNRGVSVFHLVESLPSMAKSTLMCL